MKLPLNEWAAAIRSETFIGNEPWNEFEQLVKTLANEYDIQKIHSPKVMHLTFKRKFMRYNPEQSSRE